MQARHPASLCWPRCSHCPKFRGRLQQLHFLCLFSIKAGPLSFEKDPDVAIAPGELGSASGRLVGLEIRLIRAVSSRGQKRERPDGQPLQPYFERLAVQHVVLMQRE